MLPLALTTVSQILNSPAQYDGAHLTLTGTVEAIEQRVSQSGVPYVTFLLCSDSCIKVYASGAPSVGEGETLTVEGTFAASKRELDADQGSI
jgi:hypothetical protein